MEDFDPSSLDELDFLAAQPASPKQSGLHSPIHKQGRDDFYESDLASSNASTVMVVERPDVASPVTEPVPVPEDLICPLSKRIMEVMRPVSCHPMVPLHLNAILVD